MNPQVINPDPNAAAQPEAEYTPPSIAGVGEPRLNLQPSNQPVAPAQIFAPTIAAPVAPTYPLAAVAPAVALPTLAPPVAIGGTMPVAPVVGQPVKPVGKKDGPNPNSTQNTLQIAEVRDGVVIMNDGSFRSVVMAKSINFDLMSHQEQEAVEYSYQGFLNSLYFPIQIFVRSQKVDLQPYIARLDKIRTEHDNMLLSLLMEDYIGYIDNLSSQTNIMDKKFYIVIPFFPVIDTTNKAVAQSKNFLTGFGGLFDKKDQHVIINEPDLENAKTELRNRVQAVLSGLQQCSIQGLPLDTQELIELYYDTYNPDTATRQQLKNFGDLTADVVTKGQGSAPQAHLQRELQ